MWLINDWCGRIVPYQWKDGKFQTGSNLLTQYPVPVQSLSVLKSSIKKSNHWVTHATNIGRTSAWVLIFFHQKQRHRAELLLHKSTSEHSQFPGWKFLRSRQDNTLSSLSSCGLQALLPRAILVIHYPVQTFVPSRMVLLVATLAQDCW